MRFLSDDGKVFQTQEECLSHEQRMKDAEKKKAEIERLEERRKRRAELTLQEKKLAEMRKAFDRDFPEAEYTKSNQALAWESYAKLLREV